jgi:hypothetical protein
VAVPRRQHQIISGLCPWSGLSPSVLPAKGRTRGLAQKPKPISTAGQSHRRTSGGKAETALTEAFQGTAHTLIYCPQSRFVRESTAPNRC